MSSDYSFSHDLDIRHIEGNNNIVADALSLAPVGLECKLAL